MIGKGFQENTSVHEGVSPEGVHTILHFEGDSLIIQRTYDRQPHIEWAKAARDSTEGMAWGNGRFVGHIPPVEFQRIRAHKSADERRKAIRSFFKANPALIMFDRYRKDLGL